MAPIITGALLGAAAAGAATKVGEAVAAKAMSALGALRLTAMTAGEQHAALIAAATTEALRAEVCGGAAAFAPQLLDKIRLTIEAVSATWEPLPNELLSTHPCARDRFEELFTNFADSNEGVLPKASRGSLLGHYIRSYRQIEASPAFEQFRANAAAAALTVPLAAFHSLAGQYMGLADQHVFLKRRSEVKDDAFGVEWMSLQESYVPPTITTSDSPHTVASDPRPAMPFLLEKLASGTGHRLPIVVSADMGMGKSLTARMLTLALAEKFLAGESEYVPVFVEAKDIADAGSYRVTISSLVPRVPFGDLMGSANSKIVDVFKGAAPNLPDKAVLIVDSMDELVLHDKEYRTFLKSLLDLANCDQQRLILFGRPYAFDRVGRDLQDKPINWVQIQTFSEEQVADWLARNGAKVGAPTDLTASALFSNKNIRDLTAAPLTLLMIASTWTQVSGAGKTWSRGRVFESFFERYKSGKDSKFQQTHSAVEEAVRILRGARPSHPVDLFDVFEEIAWQLAPAQSDFRAQDRELREIDVQDIIRHRFHVIGAEYDVVRNATFLTWCQHLQSSGESIVRFPHRSFAQFFRARRWLRSLATVAQPGHLGSIGQSQPISWPRLGVYALTWEEARFAADLATIEEVVSPILHTNPVSLVKACEHIVSDFHNRWIVRPGSRVAGLSIEVSQYVEGDYLTTSPADEIWQAARRSAARVGVLLAADATNGVFHIEASGGDGPDGWDLSSLLAGSPEPLHSLRIRGRKSSYLFLHNLNLEEVDVTKVLGPSENWTVEAQSCRFRGATIGGVGPVKTQWSFDHCDLRSADLTGLRIGRTTGCKLDCAILVNTVILDEPSQWGPKSAAGATVEGAKLGLQLKELLATIGANGLDTATLISAEDRQFHPGASTIGYEDDV